MTFYKMSVLKTKTTNKDLKKMEILDSMKKMFKEASENVEEMIEKAGWLQRV